MFRNILVPVDLTDRNRPAVETAARLLSPSEGKLYLIHVIETIAGLSLEEEREFYERLELAARKHLTSLSGPLLEKKMAVEAKVVYGRRAKAILEEAENLGADLMVIQSHRVEPRREEGFGTLSYQLAILARSPVLLVK